MEFIDLDEVEEKEIVSGFKARFVHSKNMTVAYWRIEAGADLPEHSHPHEQIVNLLEGEFKLTVEQKTMTLKPGSVVVIPSNVTHSGKAVTPSRLVDVFCPVREDYR